MNSWISRVMWIIRNNSLMTELSFFPLVATLRFTLYPCSSAIWHDVPRLCFFICFLLQFCWASWICRLILSHQTWRILLITSSNIFSCPIFSFFFFWDSIHIYEKLLDIVSWLCGSLRLFRNFCSSVFKFSGWLPCHLQYVLSHPVNFLFWYSTFSSIISI